MPSSFTRVLSSALVFSTRPPVSVWGTVASCLKLRGFSWKRGISYFRVLYDPFVVTSRPQEIPGLPKISAYVLSPGQPSPGQPSLLRHPIAARSGAGMLTSLPSTTPFGLVLGADLPCADERCAGTLGLSARRIFTPFIVTHVSIRTSDTSSAPRDTPSTAYRTLLYRPRLKRSPAASVHGFSPVTSSAQADSTSELLRFL